MRARLGGPDGWVSGGALRTRTEQAPTLTQRDPDRQVPCEPLHSPVTDSEDGQGDRAAIQGIYCPNGRPAGGPGGGPVTGW
jgi:hypothetical protein